MNAHEQRVLQSFRRVQGWFASHPEVMAPPGGDVVRAPALTTQLEAFDGVVTRLTDHAVEQNAQAVHSTLISKDEKALRRDVLAHLRSITKVAKALRGVVPGIGSIKMPAGGLESEPLARAAQSLSKQAAIYRATFVEHALPDDFLEQLDRAITTLRQSIDARGDARGRRAGATRGIREELALGRRIVAIMDASLTRQLSADPVALTKWQHAKRITVRRAGNRTSAIEIPLVAAKETQVA